MTSEPPPPPPKVTRHVQPLGPRVLVRLIKDSDRLDSGLFLPEGAKEAAGQALLGEVIEVARTMPKMELDLDDDDDDEDGGLGLGENVSGVPLGAKVLFGKQRGLAVPWDESLRIVDVRHLLAIVEEIPEEAMQ
ncbi:co-chaperone GroES [Pseudenhygromyxa sp. WMMC2535]|uniref:co-chaperone GroES family protein n=1 Tax=Pseudenhygromyxa sp. WMMC2535 TaxID=2712867 RepID=UPI001557C0F6|nr:co-chaperone GroES family protein [Pseudenhygromyxa sp. WMMC2535]NVB42456.1 co-chaperone GroES [Pseudenhygromyxa sp. WMMC2535]